MQIIRIAPPNPSRNRVRMKAGKEVENAPTRIGQEVLSRLMNHYGEKRVKVVEKSIDKGI